MTAYTDAPEVSLNSLQNELDHLRGEVASLLAEAKKSQMLGNSALPPADAADPSMLQPQPLVDNLRSEVSALRQEVETLRKELHEVREGLSSLKMSSSQVIEYVGALGTASNEHTQSIDDLKRSALAFEARLSRLGGAGNSVALRHNRLVLPSQGVMEAADPTANNSLGIASDAGYGKHHRQSSLSQSSRRSPSVQPDSPAMSAEPRQQSSTAQPQRARRLGTRQHPQQSQSQSQSKQHPSQSQTDAKTQNVRLFKQTRDARKKRKMIGYTSDVEGNTSYAGDNGTGDHAGAMAGHTDADASGISSVVLYSSLNRGSVSADASPSRHHDHHQQQQHRPRVAATELETMYVLNEKQRMLLDGICPPAMLAIDIGSMTEPERSYAINLIQSEITIDISRQLECKMRLPPATLPTLASVTRWTKPYVGKAWPLPENDIYAIRAEITMMTNGGPVEYAKQKIIAGIPALLENEQVKRWKLEELVVVYCRLLIRASDFTIPPDPEDPSVVPAANSAVSWLIPDHASVEIERLKPPVASDQVVSKIPKEDLQTLVEFMRNFRSNTVHLIANYAENKMPNPAQESLEMFKRRIVTHTKSVAGIIRVPQFSDLAIAHQEDIDSLISLGIREYINQQTFTILATWLLRADVGTWNVRQLIHIHCSLRTRLDHFLRRHIGTYPGVFAKITRDARQPPQLSHGSVTTTTVSLGASASASAVAVAAASANSRMTMSTRKSTRSSSSSSSSPHRSMSTGIDGLAKHDTDHHTTDIDSQQRQQPDSQDVGSVTQSQPVMVVVNSTEKAGQHPQLDGVHSGVSVSGDEKPVDAMQVDSVESGDISVTTLPKVTTTDAVRIDTVKTVSSESGVATVTVMVVPEVAYTSVVASVDSVATGGSGSDGGGVVVNGVSGSVGQEGEQSTASSSASATTMPATVPERAVPVPAPSTTVEHEKVTETDTVTTTTTTPSQSTPETVSMDASTVPPSVLDSVAIDAAASDVTAAAAALTGMDDIEKLFGADYSSAEE